VYGHAFIKIDLGKLMVYIATNNINYQTFAYNVTKCTVLILSLF